MTTSTVRVTVTMLRRLGACAAQAALFRTTFSHGTAVTPRAVARAVAAGLDVMWLVQHAVQFACNRATDAAWADYARAIDAARADYDRSDWVALTVRVAAAVAALRVDTVHPTTTTVGVP